MRIYTIHLHLDKTHLITIVKSEMKNKDKKSNEAGKSELVRG